MLENELIEVDMILQPDTNAPNIVESKIKNESAIFTVKQYLSEPTIINNLKLHEIKQHLKYYKNNFQIPTYYKSYEKKEAKNAIK